jgi:Bacterial membrane protein YfhO
MKLPRALPTDAEDEWLRPGRFAALLGILVIASFPGVLLGGASFIIRDFGLFSYPVAWFQRECLWHGQLPFWNPYNSCGVPFLAQWNTLALYPFSLIYLLLPLTWSLPFFCLAHLYWGALGMYFLAQRWSGHRLAAALAGIIFGFNGLSLNFLMWPSHIATFSWLPWVLLLGPEGCLRGGKSLVIATLAAAMQMLAGGPETIVVTWLLLFMFVGADWVGCAPMRRAIVSRGLSLGLLVALICGAQLLPFLELLARSQRDTGFGSSVWSMPIWGWANFLLPIFRGSFSPQGLFQQHSQYWTSSYYAGLGTWLFMAVAVGRVRHWRLRALAGLLVLGLFLALGERGWLYRPLRFCFPFLGFVRYPVKFVILILAIAPLLAACGFAALAGGRKGMAFFPALEGPGGEEADAVVRASVSFGLVWTIGVTLLFLLGMVLCLGWKFPLSGDVSPQAMATNASCRAFFLALVCLLSASVLKSQGRRRVFIGCLLLAVIWLDLITHMPTQNPSVSAAVFTPGWARSQLKWEPEPRLGQTRVMLEPATEEALKYHVISNLAQNYLLQRLACFPDCNLLDHVPGIHGFFSLTPAEINNATWLPYVQTNRDFRPLLDFLAVGRVTAPGKAFAWVPRPTAMPMVTAGQQPLFADDATVLNAFQQTNTDFRQVIYLPLEARGKVSATARTDVRVQPIEVANQQLSFEIEASANSFVVISQTYYPGWQARVDGRPARVWRANYAFQAVEIPAGKHRLLMFYRDRAFLVGLVLSGIGLLGCAVLWRRPGVV